MTYRKGFFFAIGLQGSGKTAFITKLAVDNFYETPRKVYSNYTLKDIPCEYVTFDINKEVFTDRKYINILDKLEDDVNYFNNSIILLDEIHVYLDSLDFMRKNNRKLQKFFSQLRKRNILLLGTTQFLMHLDVRIRRQAMNIFEMRQLSKTTFEVITSELQMDRYLLPVSRYQLELDDYFKYYDTNEVIN